MEMMNGDRGEMGCSAHHALLSLLRLRLRGYGGGVKEKKRKEEKKEN